MTRARDVADTQDNLGGAVAPFVGAKNFVLNGSYDIWQRGTTGTITSGSGFPSADRWFAWTLSAGASVTLSRQTTSDTTNLPFVQYCGRFQRVAGNTNTGLLILGQPLETANSIPLAGKTVTYSFYARAGANYSSGSSTVSTEIWQTTTTDASLSTMLATKTNVAGSSFTLTTTWQRFSITGTVAAGATQIAPVLFYAPTGTAGAADYFEVTGVQLEIGAVATPFARAGGSIGGELALCQRYYYISNTGQQPPSNVALASSIAAAWTNTQFPSVMRSAPTITIYNYLGNSGKVDVVGTANNQGTITAASAQISKQGFIYLIDSGNTLVTTTQYWFYYTASAEL
jgi:hypothetical protein